MSSVQWLNRWTAPALPIGLDLGSHGLRMVQLVGQGNGLGVGASGAYELPQPGCEPGPARRASQVEGIGALLEAEPFRGRSVVSVLPVDQVAFKNVRLPKMPDSERQQAAQWEAADRLQMPADATEVRHVLAGEVRQGEELRDEVILMAVAEPVLRDHLALLKEAGLQCAGIEVAPLALARCFGRSMRREDDAASAAVVVDVGYHCSKVLITRGGQIVFFKLIDIGGRQLDLAVSEHLDLSPEDAAQLRRHMARSEGDGQAEAQPLFGSSRRENVERAVLEAIRPVLGDLAREVGLCLRYFAVTFRGARPGELTVVGGEALHPYAVESIGEQLELTTHLGRPFNGIDRSAEHLSLDRRGDLPQWATAVGAALKNFTSQPAQRGAA